MAIFGVFFSVFSTIYNIGFLWNRIVQRVLKWNYSYFCS
jgi:hypothetical protein